jgi:hypothetical protein
MTVRNTLKNRKKIGFNLAVAGSIDSYVEMMILPQPGQPGHQELNNGK